MALLKIITLGTLIAFNLNARAASITWNTPATIASDGDVSTTGTVAYAYCWSGISTTVNGVSFTGTTSPNSGGTDVNLTGFGNNYTSFTGTGSASFSSAYQNTLTGADWNGSASATITFSNLTASHAYVAQFWVGDWRNYNTVRNETIKGSASDNITPTLNYQVGSSGSGSTPFNSVILPRRHRHFGPILRADRGRPQSTGRTTLLPAALAPRLTSTRSR